MSLRLQMLVLVAVAGCTVWNKVDVCEPAAETPVAITLNHRFEGIQKTSTPGSMVPLPGGNALVVFQSEVAGRTTEEAMEIRSVRLTPGGALLPSCERNDQLDDVLIPVDLTSTQKQLHESSWAAPPVATGRAGLITYWAEEGDRPTELWGLFYQADGCTFLTGSDRRKPFLIASAKPGEALVGNSVVSLGAGKAEDDFLVIWEELDTLGTFWAKARVVRMTPSGPEFLPTELAKDGGVAVLPPIPFLLYSMAPVVIGDGQVAIAAHYSNTDKDSNVLVWFYDDRLAPLAPPAQVSLDQVRGESLPGRTVTAAFDGRTLLVGWLQEDPAHHVSMFTRALDRDGRPRGPAVRVSVGSGGTDGYPTAMAWKDHGFLTAWRQQDGRQDAPGSTIMGRLLDASGRPSFTGVSCGEAPFLIAREGTGDRRQPTIAPLRSNDVLAIWTDDGKSGADASGTSVRGRVLPASALFVGNEHPGGPAGQAPVDASVAPAPDAGPVTNCSANPGTSKSGQPCQCNEDCEPGVECIPEAKGGVPGGICFQRCEKTAADVCGAAASCRGNPGDSACLQTCTATAECGPRRLCQGGVCLAYCTEDGDCLSGHCDIYRGFCNADGQPLSGAGLYQSCLRDDDCRSRICASTAKRCLVSCSPEKPNCPENAVCVPFPDGNGGTCLFPCVDGKCADAALKCYTDTKSGKAGCL